ncbi:hypothetical protein GCM10009099_39380 [Caenispirillum bisanense]
MASSSASVSAAVPSSLRSAAAAVPGAQPALGQDAADEALEIVQDAGQGAEARRLRPAQRVKGIAQAGQAAAGEGQVGGQPEEEQVAAVLDDGADLVGRHLAFRQRFLEGAAVVGGQLAQLAALDDLLEGQAGAAVFRRLAHLHLQHFGRHVAVEPEVRRHARFQVVAVGARPQHGPELVGQAHQHVEAGGEALHAVQARHRLHHPHRHLQILRPGGEQRRALLHHRLPVGALGGGGLPHALAAADVLPPQLRQGVDFRRIADVDAAAVAVGQHPQDAGDVEADLAVQGEDGIGGVHAQPPVWLPAPRPNRSRSTVAGSSGRPSPGKAGRRGS